MKIPKCIKKLFCCNIDEEMVVEPAVGVAALNPQPQPDDPPVLADLDGPPPPIVDPEAPAVVVGDRGCLYRVTPYFSCIILSVSQISQMVIAHFVPGRAGEEAAEVIDRAAQGAAIIAHEVADDVVDNNFYTIRARLPQAQRHPNIERWARYTAEGANTVTNAANIAVQFVATGRVPFSMHDFILGVQAALLLGSIIGYPPSTATMGLIQGIGLTSAVHRMGNREHAPTMLVALTANRFFDWLSDDFIRGIIIYPSADMIERILDRIYPPAADDIVHAAMEMPPPLQDDGDEIERRRWRDRVNPAPGAQVPLQRAMQL